MTTNISIMKEVLKLEAQALERAIGLIDEKEVEKIAGLFQELKRKGRSLVFCGVGKSGLIGQKLASTFMSLGLPSYFLHPTEALHGDLGRVHQDDAIVFLSKSGTTEEITKLLPYLSNPKDKLIALVGNTTSPIATKCGIIFDCSVEKEACINNQAPTTSSTLALAMGDALAVVYESIVGLSKEGFAENHPGGLLGKSLRMRVKDLMWEVDKCPIVKESDALKDVILGMTNKPVGGCAVVDNHDNFIGILVEGDIRRTFASGDKGLETKISDIVNRNPISISPDERASEALKLMEVRKSQISILPVVKDAEFVGFIRLHDLLKEGFSL